MAPIPENDTAELPSVPNGLPEWAEKTFTRVVHEAGDYIQFTDRDRLSPYEADGQKDVLWEVKQDGEWMPIGLLSGESMEVQ